MSYRVSYICTAQCCPSRDNLFVTLGQTSAIVARYKVVIEIKKSESCNKDFKGDLLIGFIIEV